MKKQLILINLGLILASTCFASLPLLPKHWQAKWQSMANKENIQKAKQSYEGYANFSGNWSGSCDDDPDYKESVTIKQSEDFSSITFDDDKHSIDAISETRENGNYMVDINIVHLRWSLDGQQILASGIGYGKQGNMSQGNMLAVVFKFSMFLENGKLHEIDDSSWFWDGTLFNITSSHCVYEKSESLQH